MNKISLVMATLGRTKEVEAFIDSLKNQDYKNYELIIIDQNEHYLLEQIYIKYKDEICIKYIRSSKRGLSLNRNIGLKYVTGNIVAFPDDDCEYSPNTLRKVNNYFIKESKEIYSCKVIDKYTKVKFGKSHEYNQPIRYNNVMNNCVSISVFIKFKKIEDIKFDEKLGVGTYFASGEESDLILNLLNIGYKGEYFANDVVFHPQRNNEDLSIERNNRDSLGLGALMKKEIYYRKNYKMVPFFISRLLRPMIGCIVYPKKIGYYFNSIKYRIKGYKEYRL